jgi:hypothetical protein
MGAQQRSSRWFTAAASEFSQALRQSSTSRGDKYAKNLERTVWQVIQNPGFLFMDSNTSRNETLNLERIQKEHMRLRVCEDFESQIPSDVPVVDDTKDRLLLCSKCNNKGFIVLCANLHCINRYHYACAGVRKEEVDDRDFYCADCDPQFLASIISKRKPKPAKTKRPRRRSVAATSKRKSSKNKSKGRTEAEASGGDGLSHCERDSEGGDCSEDPADDSSDDQALGSTLPSNHEKAKSADPPSANDDSQAPSSSRLRQNYGTSSHSMLPSDYGVNPSSAMDPRESLHFILNTLQCLEIDLDPNINLNSNVTTFCGTPRMKTLLHNIHQQIQYFSRLVSSSAVFDGGDASMHSSFSQMDSAVQLPFASCCGPDAASAAELQDTAPAWSLKSCSKFCPQLPDLESQIERECKYMMEQTWESLRQRNWGLGSRNQSFFQQMPGEEVFVDVDSDKVRQCLRAFSVIRSDVFFYRSRVQRFNFVL